MYMYIYQIKTSLLEQVENLTIVLHKFMSTHFELDVIANGIR